MPITKDGGRIVETPIKDKDQFERTGVIRDDQFAICDEIDRTKQVKVDATPLQTESTVTIRAGSSSGDVVITLPAESGTLVTSSGAANSFSTIQPDAGTSPAADSPTDTLTLTSGDGSVTITGNATADSIDFAVPITSATNVGPADMPEVYARTTNKQLEFRKLVAGSHVTIGQNLNYLEISAQGMTYQDDWSDTTFYVPGDLVKYEGNVYVAIEDQNETEWSGYSGYPPIPDNPTFELLCPISVEGIPAGGTTGQVLAKASNTDYDVEWVAASGGGGSGDVTGPVSSTDNAIARWDGTGGDTVQDSLVTVSDTGLLSAPTAHVGTASTSLVSSQMVVGTNSSSNGCLTVRNTGMQMFFLAQSTDCVWGTITASPIYLKPNNTTALTLQTDGGVDIAADLNNTVKFHPSSAYMGINTGSTTIAAPLHVGTGGVGSISGPKILMSYNDSSQHAMVFKNNVVEGYHLIDGSGNYIFGTYTSDPVLVRTDNTTRINIEAGGNVGIGAAVSPTAQVHIVGDSDDEVLIVQGHSTQTSKLQEWKNSSGTVVASVSNAGALVTGAITATSLSGTTIDCSANTIQNFHDAFDPRRGTWFFEEWDSGSSGGRGTWSSTASGTGAGAAIAVGEANHPGILSLTTGTDTTGSAARSQTATYYLLGGGQFTYETVVQLPTLSTVSEEYIVRVGLGDISTGSDFTDGVYFEYNRLADGDFWSIKTSSNSSRTKTVTAQSAIAGAWVRLKAVINAAASSVTFYADDVSLGTITTNIPSGAGRQLGIVMCITKSAGTTARTFLCDYWFHKQTFTSLR